MTEHFSVIVPCFNEEDSIRDTVEFLYRKIGQDSAFELIVVDDGSTDGTPQALDAVSFDYPELRIFRHNTNKGYGAALKTGISRASHALIAITDADGTYPNERIPELVTECEDFDMVVGSRTGEDVVYSKIRAIPKAFLRMWASWIAGQEIPDINSGLRVFRKDAVMQFFGILPNTFSFTTTITLAMLTNYRPVKFIAINYRARVGKSKIKPVRDTLRFIILILRTGMYFAPVRVLAPIVFLLVFLTIISLAYDISIGNLTDKSVILAMFSLNTGMFALLADMIDKRSSH